MRPIVAALRITGVMAGEAQDSLPISSSVTVTTPTISFNTIQMTIRIMKEGSDILIMLLLSRSHSFQHPPSLMVEPD